MRHWAESAVYVVNLLSADGVEACVIRSLLIITVL